MPYTVRIGMNRWGMDGSDRKAEHEGYNRKPIGLRASDGLVVGKKRRTSVLLLKSTTSSPL